MASSTSWKSRDEFKKAKELEEARKAGTAEPERDEDGKEINPHIPQYIAQAPWYLSHDKPGLKHQKRAGFEDFDKGWYERGAKLGPAATKFRKGACKNCGAMTHDAKSCTERPRKLGAKYTGKGISADEVVQEFHLDFEGKRDRWNGYDSTEHKKIMEEFEKIEQERRKVKEEQAKQKILKETEAEDKQTKTEKADGDEEEVSPDGVPNDEQEGKEANENYVTPFSGMDPRTKTTIRNLRIREDTAKYLRNLDLKSAHYDPKTRSMRANPNPDVPIEESTYAGDNFVRHTGDVRKVTELEIFSWQAAERGQAVHNLAAPSQAEMLYNEFKKKKEALKQNQKEAILAKYGGEEHMNAPKDVIFGQTEAYVEYGRDGRALKGEKEKVVTTKSKYDEDVLLNNHTSVWGSFWRDGLWGYACCHQTVRKSYCTGKPVESQSQNDQLRALLERGVPLPSSSSPTKKEEKEELTREEKIQAAIKAEEERMKSLDSEKDERKRRYNSFASSDYNVTEEEMEAYHLKRQRFDDPMANFKS